MHHESFPIEFVGGSQDGAVVEGTIAPDFCDVLLNDGSKEIYKRENEEPPFIYTHIGYTWEEAWT